MSTKNELSRMRKEFVKRFYVSNKLLFSVTLIAMVLLSGVNLLLSYLLQRITDLAMGTEIEPLLEVLLFTLGTIVLFVLVFLVQRYTLSRFMEKSMYQYKNYVFSQITKKSIHTFSGENTSKYISALTNDVASVESNYLMTVFTITMKLVTFIGAFAMMIYYSPILTLIAVLVSIFPVIASVICGNKVAIAEKAVSDQNEQFVGTVKDVLAGFSVVKSFKAEEEIQKLYEKDNSILEHKKYKRRMRIELVSLIGQGASIVAQFGVFIAGAYLAITGKGITPGTVILFVQLMNFVVDPIGSVPAALGNRKAAQGLIDKVAKAMNENVRDTGEEVANQLNSGIQLKNLSFGYSEDKTVLHQLSYEFEAGKSYALVGGSGSGKSTLLNLLMGSFQNYEGEIAYDGKELRAISSDSLYDIISIIQQNVFVFNSSIRDNITMFKSFDQNKVQSAIEMSGLATLLSQKGEEYLCGENGCNLSGGERQRISIARALLRETPVLLVDEATAALDAETAYSVSTSILKIKDLTRIVVTHGLEEGLLKQYDEILVLKNGSIYEAGTFDDLIEKKDYFYSLYNVTK